MSKVNTTKDNESPWEKMGIGTAPLGVVPDLLDIAFDMKQKFTICLVGETGIGKTPIVKQWAARHDAFVQVLNLGHCSPETIAMAMFMEDGKSYDNVPPQFLVRMNEEAKKRRVVFFLDEVNRSEAAVVNQMFTLTDERRIHDFHLHDNVLVVAAMNPSDGTYIVNDMEKDHAIRKRMNFVYVLPDLASFLRHAETAGFHPKVTQFVRARSTLFYDAAARDAGQAFACPSNWEKVSEILHSAEKRGVALTSTTVRILLQGQIGSMAAQAFGDFLEDANTVVQPDDVLFNYAKHGRQRVAKLLGKRVTSQGLVQDTSASTARTDVVADLMRGLAMTLISSKPDVEEIGEGLAQFLVDVPSEFYITFWSEHMKSQLDNTAETARYNQTLGNELKKYPAYQTRLSTLMKGQTELAAALNRSGIRAS